MNEFLEQFLIESRELAEQATGELLALEQAPDSRERLDGAFRAFHTLKGGAGIVDFAAMARAVHAAEDALSLVRSHDSQISPALIGHCLSVVDQVIQWLDEIQTTGDLPPAADVAANAVIARFGQEIATPSDASPPVPAAKHDDHLAPTARRILDEQILLLAESDPAGRAGRVASAARVAINVLRHASATADVARLEAALHAGGDAAALAEAIATALGGRQAPLPDAAPLPPPEAAAVTLRVDAQRVDALVRLTGELILAKNGIAHVARRAEQEGAALAPALRDEQARLERLMGALQQAVLSLRVLSFRTVFRRFLRVVRELSVDLGKPANLVLEGEDTEADKAIVEALFEPLLHVVRNAMDHGIESAADRSAAGKPAVATIGLRASRQGEHVVVEVSDDGKGIDIGRVRDVAAQRGVVAPDDLAALDDHEIINLIFAPGFSTASAVTGLSGRGVGMDAVRTAVERMGGRVAVESEPGRGSTFRFVLPFSVMMTSVMTVQSAGQMFGVPLDVIVETVRLPRAGIQSVGTAAAFVLRDRTIPLIGLARILGRDEARSAQSDVVAVVASVAGQLCALEVDRLGGRMDVMLKPVEGLLSGVPGIAGTTLLGDGQILIVLDLQQLLG